MQMKMGTIYLYKPNNSKVDSRGHVGRMDTGENGKKTSVLELMLNLT